MTPARSRGRTASAWSGVSVPERKAATKVGSRIGATGVMPAILDNPPESGSPVQKAEALHLYYLPAYSPELNRIEAVFKQVKHHEMPTRSFTTRADLRMAVEDGFETYRRRLRLKGNKELRLTA